MPKKLDSKTAKQILLACGLTPQEEYRNSCTPWLSKCRKCKELVSPRMSDIKSGRTRGCKYCSGKMITKKNAFARMHKANLKPVVPYPGAGVPWKSICLVCNEYVYPRLSGINTGQGGCIFCGLRKGAKKNTFSQDKVTNIFLRNNLILVGRYENSKKPVEAKCVICGHKNKPTLHDIRKYGCRKCAGKKRRLLIKEVDKIFKDTNLKRIGEYISMHRKIEAICLRCNSIVVPRIVDLKHNSQGGCGTCADWGYDNSKPSYLYFIVNKKRASYKIGIANITNRKKNDRLHRHLRDGWKEIEIWDFSDGKQARDVEKLVLRHLRVKLGIAVHLRKQDLKFQGYTETFSCKDVALKTVQRMLRQAIKEAC